MKKREMKKLSLSRETIHRLEAGSLQGAIGGASENRSCTCPTDQESVCYCWTDLCISLGYTGCAFCDS
jgi:hypothetical protein